MVNATVEQNMPDMQSGVAKEHLLNNQQMAQFVDEGYIVLEGVIEQAFCQAAVEETRAAIKDDTYIGIKQQAHHVSWQDALPGSVYREILELPKIKGAIQSLVGIDPLFDHYRIHRTLPSKDMNIGSFLQLHQDCMLDMRPFTFDINVSIYPQEINENMGGTLLLPGSQYRRVHNSNMYRYQHVRGSKQLMCRAGTVVLWHGNLWHSGRPNRSDSDRIMFLARFNPQQAQQCLWNMDDLDQYEISQIMLRGHPWIGGEHPLEWMNRIRQWRYMTADYDFDFMGYAKRIHHSFACDHMESAYRQSVKESIPYREH